MFEILFYVFLITTMFLTFFLFLVFFKTPALKWMKAMFGGKSVIAVFRRDKFVDFQTVKFESGIVEQKKYGSFIVTPNSTYTDAGGTRVMCANADIGATFETPYMELCDNLKQLGYENFYDASIKEEQLIENGQQQKTYKIAGRTFGFDNLKKLLLYDLNPVTIKKIVQIREIKIKEKLLGMGSDFKWVIMIGVMLVCAAVAIYILYGIFSKPIGPGFDVQALASAIKSGG